ncbi:Double-strand break repair protein mre11a [Paramecium bursaria]
MKHRRTQSNSEVDLKNTLIFPNPHEQQVYQEPKHNTSAKEIIIENLEDEVTLQAQKDNCGLKFGSKKRNNYGSYQVNNLLVIPEQNDLISSIEQESAKKHLKSKRIQEKENNNRTNLSLISQIQYIQQQFGLKDVTQKALNSERLDNQHNKLSFTKELQKKKQSQPPSITPDRTRITSQTKSKDSHGQKSDKILTSQSKRESKCNNNLTVSIFNNLLKEKKYSSQKDSSEVMKKIESQMRKLEKEISGIRNRQDQLDEDNKTLQNQLLDFIQESKKSREVGNLSLKKIEQLESITRRNEESIAQLKSSIISQNRRFDSTMHGTDSTEVSDYHRRFADYKINGKAYV